MTLRTYIALVLATVGCFLLAVLAPPTLASWAAIAGLLAVATGLVLLVTRGLRVGE
jgi:hypothetical protein